MEAAWGALWSHVDVPTLLRETALSARKLLAAEPSLPSLLGAEMRVHFEPPEATLTYG